MVKLTEKNGAQERLRQGDSLEDADLNGIRDRYDELHSVSP